MQFFTLWTWRFYMHPFNILVGKIYGYGTSIKTSKFLAIFGNTYHLLISCVECAIYRPLPIYVRWPMSKIPKYLPKNRTTFKDAPLDWFDGPCSKQRNNCFWVKFLLISESFSSWSFPQKITILNLSLSVEKLRKVIWHIFLSKRPRWKTFFNQATFTFFFSTKLRLMKMKPKEDELRAKK